MATRARKGPRKSKRQRGIHWLDGVDLNRLGTGVHADGANLFLRVTRGPDNTVFRSWTFRFSSPTHRVMGPRGLLIGKRRDAGIGALIGKISLQAARIAAQRMHEQILLGIDPIDAKAEARRADVQETQAEKQKSLQTATTLLKAARAYHKEHIEPHVPGKESKQWIKEIETHAKQFLPRPLGEITAEEWRRMLTELYGKVRAVAARVRYRVGLIYAQNVVAGTCASNPITDIAPLMKKVAKRAKAKTVSHASMSHAELPAFIGALRASDSVATRPLELVIQTCARVGEVICAKWNEVDLDARTWTVPSTRTKQREEHIVYLSDRVVAILKEQQRNQPIGSTYVFPSARRPKNHVSPKGILNLIDRLGHGGRVTTHGFRSSFSTWAYSTAQRERPELARQDVIEAVLAHSEQNAVKRAYSRSKFDDDRRELLAMWSAYIEPKQATVTQMPKKTARK